MNTPEIQRFQCRHIFTDGHRCGSPTLRNEALCYFHHKNRQPIPIRELARRKGKQGSFHLPNPEDRSAIQHSIGEVLQRIAANDIDPRRAGLLLYGLQIASINLPKAPSNAQPEPTVEEISLDPELGPLAPPASFIEPAGSKRKKGVAETLLEELTRQHNAKKQTILPQINAVAAPRTRSQHHRNPPIRSHSAKLNRMAFSLFGKRDKTPETPATPTPESTPRSFFDRMKQAVTRTRETLAESIGSVVALTREVDEASLDDLELVLLASDIGALTTGEIITRLRERALRHGISDGAELKSALKSEIRRILDSVQHPIAHPSTGPEVIMMVGVNGTGKTTTTGKLAALYSAQGRKVLLCAADTFRAAAIEQLEVWSQRSSVDLIKTRQGGDPSAALFDALTAAKARSTDILIVDTAGRLHTKSDLMKELDKMRRTAEKVIPGSPHQTLLVMDATTGQNGLQQARLFTEAAHVTGIVLTKLDGTAKGGIVVAIARELGLPVLYAGVGEKMEDLLPFEPAAFVDSLID